MAYSTLPTIPLVILGIIEPLMLIWAFIICVNDPFAFYVNQFPASELNVAEHLPPQAVIFTYMIANLFLLLAALAVVCCFSPSGVTTKYYLIAVAFADYGHIYASYLGLGPDLFWDVSKWNDVIIGNIAASLALNLVRWLTVFGVFGQSGRGNKKTGAGKKRA